MVLLFRRQKYPSVVTLRYQTPYNTWDMSAMLSSNLELSALVNDVSNSSPAAVSVIRHPSFYAEQSLSTLNSHSSEQIRRIAWNMYVDKQYVELMLFVFIGRYKLSLYVSQS